MSRRREGEPMKGYNSTADESLESRVVIGEDVMGNKVLQPWEPVAIGIPNGGSEVPYPESTDLSQPKEFDPKGNFDYIFW